MDDPYAAGGFAEIAVEKVRSQADLAAVVAELLADLRRDPQRWENSTLDRFLDALGAVTADRAAVTAPTWRLLAELLVAATGYE